MISERKKNHIKFLQSSEWAKMRYDLFAIRGRKCEICGSRKEIQVHHLTYERFGGEEEPDDLIILCGYHHMFEHGLIKPRKKKKRKRARKNKSIIKSKKLIFKKAPSKRKPINQGFNIDLAVSILKGRFGVEAKKKSWFHIAKQIAEKKNEPLKDSRTKSCKDYAKKNLITHPKRS